MSAQKFATDYIDVAQRIVEFREKYPDGSLEPADLSIPYRIETVDGRTFVVVVAAAYRNPTDPKPGIGMAWEQFPGATNFTRNSELQNAETSAWGRAIVAALAADTKRGIASAEEVRNRQAERDLPPQPDVDPELLRLRKEIIDAAAVLGIVGGPALAKDWTGHKQDTAPERLGDADAATLRLYLADLEDRAAQTAQVPA